MGPHDCFTGHHRRWERLIDLMEIEKGVIIGLIHNRVCKSGKLELFVEDCRRWASLIHSLNIMKCGLA